MTTTTFARHHAPVRFHLSAQTLDRIAAVIAGVGVILLLPGATVLMSVLR